MTLKAKSLQGGNMVVMGMSNLYPYGALFRGLFLLVFFISISFLKIRVGYAYKKNPIELNFVHFYIFRIFLQRQ